MFRSVGGPRGKHYRCRKLGTDRRQRWNPTIQAILAMVRPHPVADVPSRGRSICSVSGLPKTLYKPLHRFAFMVSDIYGFGGLEDGSRILKSRHQ